MRIITDENVDQLLSMSYSDNVNKLLNEPGDLKQVNDKYNSIISKMVNERNTKSRIPEEIPATPEETIVDIPSETQKESPQYATASPAYVPQEQEQLNTLTGTDTNSTQYNPNENLESTLVNIPPSTTTAIPMSNASEVVQPAPTILEVEQPDQTETVTVTDSPSSNSEVNNDSTSKKIIIQRPEESTATNDTNDTKKIIL